MAEGKNLIIERVFDAPVERLWKAWTDPVEVSKWWGPRGFTSPDNKSDLRVGGVYNFSMKPATEEYVKQMGDRVIYDGGVYKEIVEYKKLVYSDSFTDKDGNPVPPETYGMPADFPQSLDVTVEFEELPDGKTKMTLSHAGLPAGQTADGTEAGWKEMFDKLAESL